jgi:hypothetical protein
MAASAPLLLALALAALATLAAGDNNPVYDPCTDMRIQRGDGFTFGLTFASSGAFFSGSTQLLPCDCRLNLAYPSQLAVFRPKVDGEEQKQWRRGMFGWICERVRERWGRD